ncbi:MAG: ribbon-helix-helix domain-containing protein [Acidobacteria bacterium]|nr:ribbon-helix-helix domain-containing protein [Acidobacteriota bacterium]MCA1649926.1 ribbon-helix-helix domain-containing protein [Acidobacteriota bacterium]
MRTTITLDDQLLAKLKKRASEAGTSVSRLIEQAIRLQMKASPPRKRKDGFQLVTFGAGGRFSGQNIDKTSSLVEADDIDRFAPSP